jgi:hypothetical protein
VANEGISRYVALRDERERSAVHLFVLGFYYGWKWEICQVFTRFLFLSGISSVHLFLGIRLRPSQALNRVSNSLLFFTFCANVVNAPFLFISTYNRNADYSSMLFSFRSATRSLSCAYSPRRAAIPPTREQAEVPVLRAGGATQFLRHCEEIVGARRPLHDQAQRARHDLTRLLVQRCAHHLVLDFEMWLKLYLRRLFRAMTADTTSTSKTAS